MANEVRLIDANALSRKWQNVLDIKSDDKGSIAYQTFELFIDRLKEEPTIDPESLRPKGRWEMRGGKRYCTNCGKRACVTRDSDDFWYTVGTDYCPNCGADMRGEADDK